MAENSFFITKTGFISYIQCKKKLYFQINKPELASSMGKTEQLIIEESNKVGRLAREYFSNGKLIEQVKKQQSLQATQELINSSKFKAFYEAAFEYNGIFIRADILLKTENNSFELIEVKSSTKLKGHQLYDLAIQYYAIKNNGINLNKARLMFVNPDYVYDGKKLSIHDYFYIKDYTKEVEQLLPEIEKVLETIKTEIPGPAHPQVNIGHQCKKPYICPFYGHCLKGISDPILELPRASEDLLNLLAEQGITDISDIPDNCSFLSNLQQKVTDAVKSKKPFFKEEIVQELKKFTYPIHFLDFEAFNPAIPVYPDTSPYQMIPFQWSNHILDANMCVEHREFLHTCATFPMDSFAKSLIDVLGETGTIVVFSSFEITRIREIITLYPQFKKPLENIIQRIIDLQSLIRSYCYFPAFHGSFSIKNILPALSPEKSYKQLNIQNGSVAARIYSHMISEDLSAEKANSIKQDLLAYCKMDTIAMLDLYLIIIKL